MDALGDDVGDVEATVGADLEAVGDRVVAGQAPEVLDLAVGPDAADAPGIGFVPDDRAVRLGGDAIGEHRLRERDQHLGGAVGQQPVNVAGVRVLGVVGPGIREDEAAVGCEDEVVRAIELDALDLGDQHLGLAALAHPLDRGIDHLGGAPRADGAAVLADIERAIGAQHAGVRRAGGVGVAARRTVGADHGQLHAIAVDEHQRPVGQHGRTLGPAEPGRDLLRRSRLGLAHQGRARCSAAPEVRTAASERPSRRPPRQRCSSRSDARR